MSSRIHADPVLQQQLAQRGITEKTGIFGQHKVQLGTASPIRLDSIKGNSVPFQGFRTATKVARGHDGLMASSRDVLQALTAPGDLRADKLLAALKTTAEYRTLLDRLGQLSDAQKENSLWHFAPAVEALSNTELATVYQLFTSAEMDLLQAALRREGSINARAKDARAAAAQLFDLEALVLKEMSNRVSNGRLDDLIATAEDADTRAGYEAMRPLPLSRQYAGLPPQAAPVHEHDITAANLHTLANVAAQSATRRERESAASLQKMAGRGMSATPREIGDLLRQSPLTINLPAHRLLRDTSFILTPDQPMPNLFHIQQQQGVHSKGESYLRQRLETESLVFPELDGHEAIADERPTYGALNTTNSYNGAAATGYGSCSIVLKPEVARRATFIAEDTFFSPALRITPERRTQFYDLLGTSGLPAEAVVAMRDPQSAAHAALEKWLDQGAELPNLTALFLKNPPAEINMDTEEERELFAALALRTFGDPEGTRAKMASYDNLESLLFGLDDINGALLADAAERRARGEDASVRLAMNYIEAQIQGPIIPSRDFQEIRVRLDEASPAQRDRLIARMEAFSKATGVKVVYLVERNNEIDPAQVQNPVTKVNDMRETDRIGRLHTAGIAYYTQHIRTEAETLFGNALEHIQEHLHALVKQRNLDDVFPADGEVLRGTILEQLADNARRHLHQALDKGIGLEPTTEALVMQAITTTALPILERKAPLLRELQNMTLPPNATPLTPGQQAGISRWIRSSKVRTIDELHMVIQNAAEQASALRTIARAQPAMSTAAVFQTLAQSIGRTDQSMAAYMAGLPTDQEYGAENKLADMGRSISLAYTLLHNEVPPMTDAEEGRLQQQLSAPAMQHLLAQLEQVCRQGILHQSPDFGRLNVTRSMTMLHVEHVLRAMRQNTALPEFTAELSLLPESTRALFRAVAPQSMERLDAAHPAYTPFPAAANPAALPTTHGERRDFLVRHLDAYKHHEETFDRGTFYHGRGHVARAYIFASAMCSILEEQGIPVDRNAVLCGITGHDMGRQNNGTDYWEADSAAQTVDAMRTDFGNGSLGDEYATALQQCLTKQSGSLEGMIIKAADSLDYGRVAPLDLSHMPFLRGKNGESISEAAQKIRKELGKEADRLQSLSNPLCRIRPELEQLDEQLWRHHDNPDMREQIRQRKAELIAKAGRTFESEWAMNGAQFMADMENKIRESAKQFPLLSQYYR
ncbi:DUF3626 domain-containing protein [uncultured Desulfovibrio sp.]|uniref:DUF3626 domain-containing protein n=1 Tax=uncultured Desulfovibrio sp. TaxID=167968 RepID=UPI00261CBB91|nr:DUF3626 domain-containing protein [uncultured Desulfovibrio sp.]